MLGQTQKSITYYSLLSFIGLFAAVLAAMFVTMAGAFLIGAEWMREPEAQDLLVWVAMALTVLLWLPFNLWCRRQITCPVCCKSLFQTLWQIRWDFDAAEWVSNIRASCRHCGARLP